MDNSEQGKKNAEVTKMIEIVEEENTPLIFLTYVTWLHYYVKEGIQRNVCI